MRHHSLRRKATSFRRRLRFADYLENVNKLKEKLTQTDSMLNKAIDNCRLMGQQALELINDLATNESFNEFLEYPITPPDEDDSDAIIMNIKTAITSLTRCVNSLSNGRERYKDLYGEFLNVEDEYHTEKKRMDQARQEHEEYTSERVI